MAVSRPQTGLARRWRRLKWSLWRRTRPLKPVVLPFDQGLKLAVRPIDRLGKAVYLDGYSDLEHAILLHHFLKPGMVYFDVGAHLGQFALVAAKLVGPAGQVHAFEASGETFELLRQNVAINNLAWVVPNHAAVFDTPGTVKLNVCVRGKGEFNSVSKPLRPDDQVVGVEEVPALTLDDYCRRQHIERVDLVKIDVNGPEWQVIRGARAMLGRPGRRMIVVEFNDFTTAPLGYATTELRREIESLGYKVFRFEPATLKLVPEPARSRYDETENLVCVKED